jgi:hypothetical protein
MSKQTQADVQKGALPTIRFVQMSPWQKCVFIGQTAIFILTWGFAFPNVLED